MGARLSLIWVFAVCLQGQTANLDQQLAAAGKWNHGQSQAPLRAVSDAIQKAVSPAEKLAMEKRFLAFLQSEATPASKDFICRQLFQIGSEASVPVLTPMLTASGTSDAARYALERIPGAAVDRALRDALSKTSGRTRIGIVNSIGQRRDAGAVALLRPLATGPDAATAAAALNALAVIADPAAVQALGQIAGAAGGEAKRAADEAYLKAADNLVERGNKSAGLPIYRKLYAATEPPIVRAGALNGLIRTDPQVGTVLLEALRGTDARLQSIAVRALAQSSGKQLAADLQKLPEPARVRVLGSLAERRESTALPVFLASLKDPSAAVRLAALDGIGVVGDASTVGTVAALAAGDAEPERAAARLCLSRIPGKAVDQKIVDDLGSADAKLRLELIRAAGARGTAAASPALLKLARDSNDEIRREAVRALRETASNAEVAGLAALVVNPVSAGERVEIGRSLAAALRRGDGSRIEDVLSAYAPATDAAARATLLSTMGPTGNAKALPVLRAGLRQEDAEVKRAAILALTDWPDGTPVPDMFEVARGASNPAHQVLALRGAIKLTGLAVPARPARDTVQLLADAMSLARQVEEKRAVLAALPRFPVPEALALARKSLDDPQVAAEAKQAVGRLERAIGR